MKNWTRYQLHRCSRFGVTTLEILATVSILAIWATMTIPFLTQLSATRQGIADRELALRELRNQVELFRVNPERELTLSDETENHLKNAELSLNSDVLPDSQITEHRLAISWENRRGQRTQPIQLSTWTFQSPNKKNEGAKP